MWCVLFFLFPWGCLWLGLFLFLRFLLLSLLLLSVGLLVVLVLLFLPGFSGWFGLFFGFFLLVRLFLLALLSVCLAVLFRLLALVVGFSGLVAFLPFGLGWFAGLAPSLLLLFRLARSGFLFRCGLALLPCVRLVPGFLVVLGLGLLFLWLAVRVVLVLFFVRAGVALFLRGRLLSLLVVVSGFVLQLLQLKNSFHFSNRSGFHMSKKFNSFSQLSMFLSSNSLQSKLYWFAVSGRNVSVFSQAGSKFVFQRANGSFKMYNNNNHIFVTIPENFNV